MKAKYANLPFNIRNFEEETKARMGVGECISHKVIEPFQVLYEKPSKYWFLYVNCFVNVNCCENDGNACNFISRVHL